MKWANSIVLVAVLSLVGLLGFGLTTNADELPSPLVGNPAPTFELRDLQADTTVSMAALAGRPVLVNFWASWCLGCIEEHPTLVRAWHRFKDQGVVMVGVVYQDSPTNARRYLARYGDGWPQVLDPGSRTALDYGVYGIPETFFIDPTGTISHKHIGPITDDVITTEIERLLSPEPVVAPPTDSTESQETP